MRGRILLAHCNHLYFDRKQVRKMQPYPPLQTLLAAAVLRRRGFEVYLFDSTLCEPEAGFEEALACSRPDLVVLCEDNFNYLTKMCLLRNRELAFSMCRKARESGIPVAVNSSDATDHTLEYLAGGADYVIVGEVEQTLIELAAALLGCVPDRPEEIAGLAFRDRASGEVRRTRPRPLLPDLDALPLPAWDLVDMDSYRSAWQRAHGYFSLNMVASRGCPYRCNWCARPLYGDSYRTRAPEAVAGEMQLLKSRYQPDRLWFADDIFALSARWTLRFAEAVEELDARIPFQMQSRCDLMTRDTVAALARAGCAEVWMGAESGSQKILDAMDKGIRVEQIYRARENLARHGIRACFFLQFGYPGETWEDIEATLKLVREAQPDDVGISVSYPMPGTKFYDLVAAQLGDKRNWSDSDDLAMMFRGTYTTEFYRLLRDAVHLEVDLCRGRCDGEAAETRLQELWHRIESLESACRNENPTLPWICS